MHKIIRIGTRESQLAVWQAEQVKKKLVAAGFAASLVFIKSEGDTDLQTPLYEMGVQGVFTRALDQALLNNKIDIAVHSMKDVPTQLAKGIIQAAVLERASHKDVLVYKQADGISFLENKDTVAVIATSSIRRKCQWLHRFPQHKVENLRGNVNTRLRKLEENKWNGALFAAAGLESICLLPDEHIALYWMLPAPAHGAIMIVCRGEDDFCFSAMKLLNDHNTEICTRVERDFLRALLGGCSTPVSALAEIKDNELFFRGNVFSLDGKEKAELAISCLLAETSTIKIFGELAAGQLLKNGGSRIVEKIHNATK